MRSLIAALADLVASLMIAGSIALMALALGAQGSCPALPADRPPPSPRPSLPLQPRDGPLGQFDPRAKLDA